MTSAAAQVRLTVTIEAGPGTNALEKAITGSAQADGVDLYQTAVTVSVAGLDFTSLDPATATLEQLVSDIEANVVAALTE